MIIIKNVMPNPDSLSFVSSVSFDIIEVWLLVSVLVVGDVTVDDVTVDDEIVPGMDIDTSSEKGDSPTSLIDLTT